MLIGIETVIFSTSFGVLSRNNINQWTVRYGVSNSETLGTFLFHHQSCISWHCKG